MIVRVREKCFVNNVMRSPSPDPKRPDLTDFDYVVCGEDGLPVLGANGRTIDGPISRDENGKAIGPLVPVAELGDHEDEVVVEEKPRPKGKVKAPAGTTAAFQGKDATEVVR